MKRNLNRKSKFLSLVLRHKPEVIGCELDKNGWLNISEIIKNTHNTRNHLSKIDIDNIVQTDDKQRYALSECGKKIRANQGHSIKVDLQLDEVEPPKVLMHGTKGHVLESIFKDGLKPMKRDYVHLSDDFETALNVGNRRIGNTVMLYINCKKMVDDGYKFYKSINGVWLTKEVPTKYIQSTKN